MPTPMKTVCPISKEEFFANAQPIVIKIGDKEVRLTPREFSTGSFGYYLNEKTDVRIHDKEVKLQTQVTFTVVGSKEAPRGTKANE